jgi:holo-ACP synthase/triphosphoribosyl-dephospho-CoA synthase
MQINEILQNLLDSKEVVYLTKLKLIKESQLPVISLALNVPGWPKTNSVLRKFFFEVLKEFQDYALASRLLLKNDAPIIIENNIGLTFIIPFYFPKSSTEAKIITERFEDKHPLGRFIDVDIVNSKGNPISGKKEKLCFFCLKNSAISCMRNKTHSIDELRSFQTNEIRKYLIHKLRIKQSDILSEILLYALLSEISLDPKPGLVSPSDNGAHTDMDYHTFIQSTAAISNSFNRLFSSILVDDAEYSIDKLREIGIQAEQQMKWATSGINTHRGAIFLLLLLGYSIAKNIKENNDLTDQNIKTVILEFNQLLKNDPLNDIEKSHGNEVRKQTNNNEYGIKSEITNGLPSLFYAGIIPFRIYHFTNQKCAEQKRKIMIYSLLNIMSQNNDTNIIYRGNENLLNILKQKSKNCLRDIKSDNWESYEQLCNWAKANNLSPGGSADILAASIFTYLCQINPKLKYHEF